VSAVTEVETIMSKPQPFVVTPKDSRPLHVAGETVTVLANAERTGSVELFLQEGPEGAGPPPHLHAWDEAYYVLEGAIDVVTGERRQTIAHGDFVFVPGGTLHTFRIKTTRARFLCFNSRAGASAFFGDIDREVGHTLDVGKMRDIASRHAIQLALPLSSPEEARSAE
jgi:mannose-6-phosphate isomerase-like protein (cupin superfamily)